MKKNVLREYLKNREVKEQINKMVEKNQLKTFAEMGINAKIHAKPRRVKQKGEE